MNLDQSPGSGPMGGLRGWGRGQNSFFSEYGHDAYQIKGMTYLVTCWSIFACRPSKPDPWDGFKRSQNYTFTEHGHVADQIKCNHECSNMVAKILPVDPPHDSLEVRSV